MAHSVDQKQFEVPDEGETISMEDFQARFSRNKSKSKLRRAWETKLYKYASYWSRMVSAGKKVDIKEPYGWYDYNVMDKPLAGTGVDVYIVDSGLQLVTGYWCKDWDDAPPCRGSHFRGLRGDDMSPYVDETMVSFQRLFTNQSRATVALGLACTDT